MDYSKCWLDYQPVDTIEKELLTYFQSCEGEIVESAVSEYKLAMENMAGKVPQTVTKEEAGVVFSVDSSIKEGKDGYIITKEENRYQITGESESGLLYGVFHFLRLIRTKQMNCLPVHNTPEMPLRMMNHWDNMDGSIERGYSGESFFYKDYKILWNDRIVQYVRMMASIGINAIVINNVNVHENETYLITDRYLQQVKQYADLFAKYGIKLYTSVNFAAPMELDNFTEIVLPVFGIGFLVREAFEIENLIIVNRFSVSGK